MMDFGSGAFTGATGKKTGALLGLPALSSVLLPTGPERGDLGAGGQQQKHAASRAAAAR